MESQTGHHRVHASPCRTAGKPLPSLFSPLPPLSSPSSLFSPLPPLSHSSDFSQYQRRSPDSVFPHYGLSFIVGLVCPCSCTYSLCADCVLVNCADPSSILRSQGVEVFEEKLNPLCMQWLIDNGEHRLSLSIPPSSLLVSSL